MLLLHTCCVYVCCAPPADCHPPDVLHVCVMSCRQHINKEKLTMDDGLMMRVLADSPGGLELHIGVGVCV